MKQKSEIKKRRNRARRLPVNQEGLRIYDRNINRLTVIAEQIVRGFRESPAAEVRRIAALLSMTDKKEQARTQDCMKYRKGFEADPRFTQFRKN